jgi:hypothetical protein
MVELFSAQYAYLWMIVLALLLYLPVRRLIWILYIRRAERDGVTDAAARGNLKRRAGITAALLCFVFSFFYVSYLFGGRP